MAENGMRREGQDRQQDERGISACALTSELSTKEEAPHLRGQIM